MDLTTCSFLGFASNYGPTIKIQSIAESHGCDQVLWLYGPEHEASVTTESMAVVSVLR